MAQWKESLEPYIKVQERIRTSAIVPVAGEDLIVGVTIISDAGPSTPTLINGQSEYVNTFASRGVTDKYVKSLNKLYKGDDNTLAETVWLNAYRLAGSVKLLVVRASKANDIFFAKPLVKGDEGVYILRDGQLLKSLPKFKVVIDVDKDNADHSTDGWSLAINKVGVIGNRTTDEGAQYDYYVQTLPDLVEYLNDTATFFSPHFTFHTSDKGDDSDKIEVNEVNKGQVKSVVFHEVYVASNFLDTTDPRVGESGLSYVVTCEPDWTIETNEKQKLLDLSGKVGGLTNFEASKYYALNNFNANNTLKVRIRRFNHDAVIAKELSENSANEKGESPYKVITKVLDTFTKNGKLGSNGLFEVSDEVKYRDFYEVAVYDPSISDKAEYFNIGNISGRGDITVAELNKALNMIKLSLPDNMEDLKLNYYGYTPDTVKSSWQKVLESELQESDKTGATPYSTVKEMYAAGGVTDGTIAVVGKKDPIYLKFTGGKWQNADSSDLTGNPTITYEVSTREELDKVVKKADEGELAKVGITKPGTYYKYTKRRGDETPNEQLYVDLSIDPAKYHILDVSDTDMIKALDQIEQNEVYVVEGLADCGNTSAAVQSALSNMAVNLNYFYPVSPVNSTNYLAIANSMKRISQDSSKLYVSAPWDVDSGTVGFKFYASPDVLYWEMVSRNKSLNREFADTFGQTNGIVKYQNPVVEFNKKTRQLLLSRKINTVMWNTQTQTWNMNESVTKQTENNIMGNDGNARLFIRISKAMPVLLRQFIGRRISPKLWKDAESIIDQWFRNVMGPLEFGVDDYKITINETNNPTSIQLQNKMRVLVEVRYQRSLKYIEVFNDALDLGMDFNGGQI